MPAGAGMGVTSMATGALPAAADDDDDDADDEDDESAPLLPNSTSVIDRFSVANTNRVTS